jgi:hypothetical protein
MRFIVLLSAFALLALARLSPLRGAEPEPLLQEIEQKWHATVVRDDVDPERPVVEIAFGCDSDIRDDTIKKLSAFPRLRRLNLIGGQDLTNKGLEAVGELRSLESVSLRHDAVTADGLKHLARLPRLKALFLWDIPLTKENAAALEGCRALERLELRSVEVSPEAVKSLQKLPRLKAIDGLYTSGAFRSADELREAFPGVKVRVRH